MASKFSFSGHETFPLRVNWLKKAVDVVGDNATIFNSDMAIAEFGVGRNMVRSMRHWGLATGVLEPNPDSPERGAMRVSELGKYLFGDNGVDPYCEDTATLWLLHWLLCRLPGRASLWHFVFGHWREGALELRNLLPALQNWLNENGSSTPSVPTLRRDLRCLQSMYVAPSWLEPRLEAISSCPLTSLGMLYESGGVLYLREGRRRCLAPEIFAFAVLEYWNRKFPGTATLSIQEVLWRRTSPGQIFLLSEEEAFELVDRVEALEEVPFRLDVTAGLQQLIQLRAATPQSMLDRYYTRSVITAE